MKKLILLAAAFLIMSSFTTSNLSDGIPAGTILPFGGTLSEIPRGYLLCDGKLYVKKDKRYAHLYKAIGVAWGGNGNDKFAVPDLRGQFLRGVSGSSGADPDSASRQNSRPDLTVQGNSGNLIGSKQKDQLASHSHDIGARDEIGTNCFSTLSGCGPARAQVSTSKTGGSETRPVNAYVYFIIKL